MKYKSFAQWPKGTVDNLNGSDITEDTHDNKESAKAVVSLLYQEGFRGNQEVFPIVAWTEPDESPTEKTKWVLLKGITPENIGDRFFTSYRKDDTDNDLRKSSKGELWYGIIGYAETVEEAQEKLYGVSYQIQSKPKPTPTQKSNVQIWTDSFNREYAKACNTSQPNDWYQATLTARQLVNEMVKAQIVTDNFREVHDEIFSIHYET